MRARLGSKVVHPSPYQVTQTIRRGETALERDELEGLITAHNSF